MVTISMGDLTGSAADAIVNAANNDLVLGAGLAGAIRSRGGPEIQRECDAIGPIAIGEAAITSGGKLKAKFVIHAASMRLGGATSEKNLRTATHNSMARAAERGLTSIAMPAIGTGFGGLAIDRCALIMLEEVRAHLRGPTSIRRVDFVLFDRQSCDVFRKIFDSMS